MRVSRHALTLALIKHNGDCSAAAKEVGLERTSVYQRLKRDDKMREAVEAAEAFVLQKAVSNVGKAIEAEDMVTSRWYLERKGKHLGFGNTLGVKLSESDINEILDGATPEQLRKLADGG